MMMTSPQGKSIPDAPRRRPAAAGCVVGLRFHGRAAGRPGGGGAGGMGADGGAASQQNDAFSFVKDAMQPK